MTKKQRNRQSKPEAPSIFSQLMALGARTCPTCLGRRAVLGFRGWVRCWVCAGSGLK